MKRIYILLIIVLATSCQNEQSFLSKITIHDTVYLYYNDTIPKPKNYNDAYCNFTDKIYVHFSVSRDYEKRQYYVKWGLFINGDCVDANTDYVLPQYLEIYKAKIKTQENKKVPNYLKVWN